MKKREINGLLEYPFVIFSNGSMVVFITNKTAENEIQEIQQARKLTISVVFNSPVKPITDYTEANFEIYQKELEFRYEAVKMVGGVDLEKILLYTIY